MGEFSILPGSKDLRDLESRLNQVMARLETRVRAIQGLDNGKVDLYGPVDTHGSTITTGATSGEFITKDDAIRNALYVSNGIHNATRPISAPVVRLSQRAVAGDEAVRLDQLDALQSQTDEIADEISGTVTPTANTHVLHLPIRSPVAAFGTYYMGGFYMLGTPDSNFGAAIPLGTVLGSYGARVFLVAGGTPATPVSITIAGTSIADDGTRTGGDSEIVVIPTSAAANSYFQSTKRWIGQITLTRTAGPALLCNYGFASYWDSYGSDFTVLAVEADWFATASDPGLDLGIVLHSSVGWTYVPGGAAIPPAPFTQLSTDHGVEREAILTEQGSWRHRSLTQAVTGSSGQGILAVLTTTVANAIEIGSIRIQVRDS